MILVQYVIEHKSVLPHYEQVASYSSLESAQRALPVWQKGSKRPYRIVKLTREVIGEQKS